MTKELYDLCSSNDITIMKLRSLKTFDLDYENDNKSTPFMILCANKAITYDIIKYMVEQKRDIINKVNKNIMTPFMYLCKNPSITFEMVLLLENYGLNLQKEDSIHDNRIIISMYLQNSVVNIDILKYFVESGLRLTRYLHYMSPLHMVCDSSYVTLDIIKYLLDNQPRQSYQCELLDLCSNKCATTEQIMYLAGFLDKKIINCLCDKSIIMRLLENKGLSFSQKLDLIKFFRIVGLETKNDESYLGNVADIKDGFTLDEKLKLINCIYS